MRQAGGFPSDRSGHYIPPSSEGAGCLSAALEYRGRGWSVLPLTPEDKTPHIGVLRELYGKSEWGSLAERPASLPEIRAWFELDPAVGVGILTGRASGGLVVVDVDGRFPGHHPPTAAVRTGRGWHIYAQANQPIRGRCMGWGDLKGEGGYVVAPPSLHPSGRAYEWAISPDEIELVDFGELHLDLDSEPVRPEGNPRQGYIPTLGEAPPRRKSRLRGTGDALAGVESAVLAALPVLGVSAPFGQSFRCVVPEHDDRRPSASVFQGDDGIYRYRDWHGTEGREWWTLAEVRAAQVSGRLTQLRAPTAARWYRRLFAEAGVIELADVSLPALPPGTPAQIKKVREGFLLLLRLREGQDPGEQMPFARRFAADWSGVTETEAREGIAEMQRLKVIEKTGEHVAGGRRMYLYRPGRGSATLQRAQRRVTVDQPLARPGR